MRSRPLQPPLAALHGQVVQDVERQHAQADKAIPVQQDLGAHSASLLSGAAAQSAAAQYA